VTEGRIAAGETTRDRRPVARGRLTNTTFEMKVVENGFPAIRFHKQREAAGLMADRIADLA
jgi:hypothetical protein